MTHSAIGYKIRQERKALGLTQAAMALELGISASYLNLIEANKRAVGGSLLSSMAALLNIDIDTLTGVTERRLVDDLRELRADPMLRHVHLRQDFADEVVAGHPDWARALLTLYRAYLDNNQTVAMLSDRLNRDPLLQESVHRMLTHITSIRSSAEILNDIEDLEPEQRRRFQRVIHSQSTELTREAQHLVSSFGQDIQNRSLAASEEVDDFIIGNRNHFEILESAADELRLELDKLGRRNIDGALVEYLQKRHGISVRRLVVNHDNIKEFGNQARLGSRGDELFVSGNAPPTTRRFQMMRTAAKQNFSNLLNEIVLDHRLTSDPARERAYHVLSAYIAGAALLPYDAFLEDAESFRYDIEILRQKYQAGYEQICHRLVTLRNPLAEGVPFAFLRVDPSGHISKRFPLHGFPLPRYGHACPLWTVFSAFQTPSRITRQLAEFPGGSRFLMISRTVTKRPAAFHAQSVMFAIMLACDSLHADRTVYAEGLDFDAPNTAVEVGSNCRLCNRPHCQQRQEPAISADSPE